MRITIGQGSRTPNGHTRSAWTRRAITVAVAAVMLLGCDGTREERVDFGQPIILEHSSVVVVGTSDALATVEDLEVLPDGTVWVLNSVAPFFVRFGPDGAAPEAHGNRGGGPEEFRWPAGFVNGGIDREAWTFDARRHALIRVSQPGDGWLETRIPTDSMPPGSLIGGLGLLSNRVRTARLGDEIVLARTTGSMGMEGGIVSFWSSIWGADLLGLDPATGSVRNLLNLRETLGDPIADFEFSEGAFPLWFRLWEVCGDNQLRVYDRFRNEVRTFASDGTEGEATPLPPVRLTEVTPTEFARAVFPLRQAEVSGNVRGHLSAADSTRLLHEMAQSTKGSPAQLARYLPRYVDFRCTNDGTLWLQPFDTETGGLTGGTGWLRVTPGGSATEVSLPTSFDPYRFTSERIWGVQRDEFDVASLAWIEVPTA